MPTRKAPARWEGTLEEAEGHVELENGTFKASCSFSSRVEAGAGIDAIKLPGAADAASCFATAPSPMRGKTGLMGAPLEPGDRAQGTTR